MESRGGYIIRKLRFTLGQIVATNGVMEIFSPDEITILICRHVICDWGDLCEDDKKANELALASNSRLFSSYVTSKGNVWIITETDRSSTTVLLPNEY